jgi:ABC-type phosphate transport system substrate-binding protein
VQVTARLEWRGARRVLLAAVALAAASPAGAAEGFKVIVNAKLAGAVVPKETLADIYLGRVKRWRDGRPIAAVDLPSRSPVRVVFSTTVLGMSLPGVRAHWMPLLAAGERPPLVRPSDDAVAAFVAARPGAIGYVSESATLPETVKVVTVE